jgi:hypothetical protein
MLALTVMPDERALGRRLAGLLLVAALTSAAPAGAASAEDRAAARQHASKAQELKKRGKLAEACKHWQEVERLDPKLPTLMELAECTERLGKLVAAQAYWSLARDRAKRDEKPQSKARAEERLAAVQKRVAHLTLQPADSISPTAQVLLDDTPLEPASLGNARPIDPGEHVVVVKLAGHDDAKHAVKLAPGDHQTLPISAGPETAHAALVQPAAPPAASPSVAPAPALQQVAAPARAVSQPATGWWSGERTAGAVLGLVGVAAIGGGSALLIASQDPATSVDSRMSLGATSIVTGGVLFVAGVVLLVSKPSDEAHAALSIAPSLLVARHGTLLGAVGEF